MNCKTFFLCLLLSLNEYVISQTCDYTISCKYNADECSSISGYTTATDVGYQWDHGRCNDNKCECNLIGYDPYSCLPSIYGCDICNTENSTAVGNITVDNIDDDPNQYSCVNNMYSNHKYEIRALGIHGNGGNNNNIINVELVYCGTNVSNADFKPVKLILLSHEKVAWNIYSNDNIVLNNISFEGIYINYYYQNKAYGRVSNNTLKSIPIHFDDVYAIGYGNDKDNGRTKSFLQNAMRYYGDFVYTFIGSYSFNNVKMCVGRDHDYGYKTINDTNSDGHPYYNGSSKLGLYLIISGSFVSLLIFGGLYIWCRNRKIKHSINAQNISDIINVNNDDNINTNVNKYNI